MKMKKKSDCIILPLATFFKPLRNVAKDGAVPQSRGNTVLETKRGTQLMIETSASDSGHVID